MNAEAAMERVDWQGWSRRWDAQQSFLVVRREERFRVMLDLAEEVMGRPPSTILDLACGTGDLARRALQRFSAAEVVGLDADPLLLAIARGAIGDAGGRARWVRADLRDPNWPAALSPARAFDLVMSSTALHWLPATALHAVYRALYGLVVPCGMVMNADVIPPASPGKLANAADRLRSRAAREAQANGSAERYSEWWAAIANEPAFAALHRERSRLFEDHPDDLDLPPEHEQLRALREGGFAEAAVLWRFFDYGVVAAVKSG